MCISIKWAYKLIALTLILLIFTSGIIEDGIADEKKYPNVIKPFIQFGTYGSSGGRLNEPVSVQFSSNNNLYVLENMTNRVQCFSLNGKALFTFGGQGSLPGEFISPTSMCIDANKIYVCDAGNNRIQTFDLQGNFIMQYGSYGTREGEFNYPHGVYAKAGRIYVADEANNRIQVFNEDFKFLFSIGKWGKDNGTFIHPTDVVATDKGEIIVCDSKNNRIQKFNSEGKFQKSWGGFGSYGGLMATPTDLEIFGNELLVTDLINHRFQAFNLEGKYLYQWGRHPTIAHEGFGRTHYPVGLTVSRDGKYVAVCEPIENRIQIFKKADINKSKPVDDLAWWDKKARFHYGSGASSTGTMLVIGEPDTHMVLVFDLETADKPKLIAKFGGYGSENGEINMPSGIAFDTLKKIIYISDKGNNRIQGFLFDEKTAKLNLKKTNELNIDSFQANYESYQLNSSSTKYALSIGGDVGRQKDQFNEPSGLVLAPSGYLYAVDNGNARIKVFDRNYKLIKTFGSYGSGKGQMKSPISIAYKKSAKGNDTIYVMDQFNYRIQAFDTSGKSLFTFGSAGDKDGQFILPFGLTVGHDGSVYVTDEGDHSVKKFTAGGKFIKKWGGWGTEQGMFYKPKGIAQAANGLLYVLDFGNHRGQIFKEDGSFVNYFGLGELQTGLYKNDPNDSLSKENINAKLASTIQSGPNLYGILAFALFVIVIILGILLLRKSKA